MERFSSRIGAILSKKGLWFSNLYSVGMFSSRIGAISEIRIKKETHRISGGPGAADSAWAGKGMGNGPLASGRSSSRPDAATPLPTGGYERSLGILGRQPQRDQYKPQTRP